MTRAQAATVLTRHAATLDGDLATAIRLAVTQLAPKPNRAPKAAGYGWGWLPSAVTLGYTGGGRYNQDSPATCELRAYNLAMGRDRDDQAALTDPDRNTARRNQFTYGTGAMRNRDIKAAMVAGCAIHDRELVAA